MSWQIGDCVTWTSQSRGITLAKVGHIAAIVRRRGDVEEFIEKLRNEGTKFVPMNDLAGHWRDEESYLILVPHPGRGYPRLYWPQVSLLACWSIDMPSYGYVFDGGGTWTKMVLDNHGIRYFIDVTFSERGMEAVAKFSRHSTLDMPHFRRFSPSYQKSSFVSLWEAEFNARWHEFGCPYRSDEK